MNDYDNMLEKEIKDKLEKKALMLKVHKKQHWNANFGMIASLGGVIISPIILSIWLGSVLEKKYPMNFSWQLTMIFVGFLWGFVNAYYWIKLENAKIAKNEQRDEDEIKRGLK